MNQKLRSYSKDTVSPSRFSIVFYLDKIDAHFLCSIFGEGEREMRGAREKARARERESERESERAREGHTHMLTHTHTCTHTHTGH
jgi:hypothetical protein